MTQHNATNKMVLKSDLKKIEKSKAKLKQLYNLLSINRQAKDKLQKIQNHTNNRIHHLREKLTSYSLKLEHPPATQIVSYLNFDKNLPNSLKECSKYGQQKAIKNSKVNDRLFISQLEKKREIKSKNQRKVTDIKKLPSDASKIDFLMQNSNSCYRFGINLYQQWFEMNVLSKRNKIPLTQQEIQLIVQKQKKYGNNFSKIMDFINRSYYQVYYSFHMRINPEFQRGRWTLRQSVILVILVEHYGRNWAKIAKKIKEKSEIQVRERFCNILDPFIHRLKWTPELQQKLYELAPEYGYSWKQMTKVSLFEGKTDNQLWRKFRKYILSKPTQYIYQKVAPLNRRLAEKLIKLKLKSLHKNQIEDKVKSFNSEEKEEEKQ